MSIPTTRFRNNDLASHAVYRFIKTMKPPVDYLTLRPWNPYQPSHTQWYLVPSTEWPAYRFGKLYIGQSPETGMLFTGYYVERGLGSQVADLAKANHIMNTAWRWPRFRCETQEGKLKNAVRNVLDRTGLPLQIDACLYYFNHVRDPETGEEHPDDEAVFRIRDASLDIECSREAKAELSPLNRAKTLQDLIRYIENIPSIDWSWIDFLMGVSLQYSKDDTGEWSASEVWHNALEPWLPWVH